MAEFRKLSNREHILLRPHMYIGEPNVTTVQRFVNGELKELQISPGLLKITNEILDNSVDEYIRSEFKYADKITITMDQFSFTVEDNGRGIPVVKYEDETGSEWQPQVAWCEARAGTSFDANRVGPGTNGVGSVIANVFSKQFIGKTSDGKHRCQVKCTDNMEHIQTTVQKTSHNGTSVYIEPDFERFGLEGYTEDHIVLIRERVLALASTYDIQFVFNGEKIRYKKPVDYLKIYGETYIPFQNETSVFGIYPSNDDEYVQHSNIDGLDLVQGGTHEAYIMRELCYKLRDIIKSKHKLEMSPAEIKRGMKLVFVGKLFPNMEFESQTKEKLTNLEKDVKKWLGDIPFDKLAKKVYACKDILEPIIETKLAKQMAADKRAVTLAQKKMAKKVVEKHLAAQSQNTSKNTLFIVEGDSAIGMLGKVRDTKTQGGFPLRGMPLNTYDMPEKKILENKEIANIMAILGLSFGMKDKDVEDNIQYGSIGIMTDADTDGLGAIMPLLLNFFWHWPALFKSGRIYLVNTPRYICTKKSRGKEPECVYFYDTATFEKERDKYKNWEIRYIKGLGSLRDYEYQYAINHKENWSKIVVDNPDNFGIMFSDDVQKRKDLLTE